MKKAMHIVRYVLSLSLLNYILSEYCKQEDIGKEIMPCGVYGERESNFVLYKF
jgi:hypothetical protein